MATLNKKTINAYNDIALAYGMEYVCIGEEFDKFRKTDAEKEGVPKTMKEMIKELEHIIWCNEQDINEYYYDDEDAEHIEGARKCRKLINRAKAFIKRHKND